MIKNCTSDAEEGAADQKIIDEKANCYESGKVKEESSAAAAAAENICAAEATHNSTTTTRRDNETIGDYFVVVENCETLEDSESRLIVAEDCGEEEEEDDDDDDDDDIATIGASSSDTARSGKVSESSKFCGDGDGGSLERENANQIDDNIKDDEDDDEVKNFENSHCQNQRFESKYLEDDEYKKKEFEDSQFRNTNSRRKQIDASRLRMSIDLAEQFLLYQCRLCRDASAQFAQKSTFIWHIYEQHSSALQSASFPPFKLANVTKRGQLIRKSNSSENLDERNEAIYKSSFDAPDHQYSESCKLAASHNEFIRKLQEKTENESCRFAATRHPLNLPITPPPPPPLRGREESNAAAAAASNMIDSRYKSNFYRTDSPLPSYYHYDQHHYKYGENRDELHLDVKPNHHRKTFSNICGSGGNRPHQQPHQKVCKTMIEATNCKLSRRLAPTCQLRPDLRRQVDNQCLYKQHYLPYPPPPAAASNPPHPPLINNATNQRSWDELRPKYHPSSYDFLINSRANHKSRALEARCDYDEDVYEDHYMEMNRKGGGKKGDKQDALSAAANPAIVPSFNRCKSGTTLLKNETSLNGMINRSSNCSTNGDKRHSWKLQPNFVTRAFLSKNVMTTNERQKQKQQQQQMLVENSFGGDSKKFLNVESSLSSSRMSNQRVPGDNSKCDDSDPKLAKYEHELEQRPKTSLGVGNFDNKNKIEREKSVDKRCETTRGWAAAAAASESRSTYTNKMNVYDRISRRDSTWKKENRAIQVDDKANTLEGEERESEIFGAECVRSPAVALLTRLLPLLVKRSDNNNNSGSNNCRERSKDCSEDRGSSDCGKGGDNTNNSASNRLSVSRLKILKSVALLLSTSNRKQFALDRDLKSLLTSCSSEGGGGDNNFALSQELSRRILTMRSECNKAIKLVYPDVVSVKRRGRLKRYFYHNVTFNTSFFLQQLILNSKLCESGHRCGAKQYFDEDNDNHDDPPPPHHPTRDSQKSQRLMTASQIRAILNYLDREEDEIDLEAKELQCCISL